MTGPAPVAEVPSDPPVVRHTGKTSYLTHRLILPPFMLYSAWRNEGSGPPYRLDEFSADMARAAALPLREPEVPRRIFILWSQGIEAAPDIVRASHASWMAGNPGWEVVLLDSTTVGDWIDVSDLHPKLPMATQSDAIRLRLLSRHGGVWADATTLCMRPLDDWLGRHLSRGFFVFGPHSRTRIVDSWFMAGRPGAPVLEAWRHTFDGYIRNRAQRLAYFCLHHTFEYLMRTDPAFRAAWAATPPLNAHGPQMLKWLLTQDSSRVIPPSPEAMAEVPLFKLNRRPGYEDLDKALPKLAEFGLRPFGTAP